MSWPWFHTLEDYGQFTMVVLSPRMNTCFGWENMSSCWIVNPAENEEESRLDEKNDGLVLPLLDTVSAALTKTSYMTQLVVKSAPGDCFPPLLRSALINSNALSVNLLLKNWPLSVLDFHQILPFGRRKQVNRKRQRVFKLGAIPGVTEKHLNKMVIKSILDWRPENCRVRLVDARRFEIDSHMTSFIIECLTKSAAASTNNNEGLIQVDQDNKSADNEAGPIALWFNCHVSMDIQRASSFIDALKLNYPFQLFCHKLILQNSDSKSINRVLPHLNPQVLQYLSLGFIELCNDMLDTLCPQLSRFTRLKGFSIHYSHLDFTKDSLSLASFAATLGCMPQLARLDLYMANLGGSLRPLLTAIRGPLVYLCLQNCRLCEQDIRYLADSHHMAGLRELNMCGNYRQELYLEGASFWRLMERLSGQLQILQVTVTGWECCPPLELVLSKMAALVCCRVNLVCDSQEAILRVLSALLTLPLVQHIELRPPEYTMTGGSAGEEFLGDARVCCQQSPIMHLDYSVRLEEKLYVEINRHQDQQARPS